MKAKVIATSETVDVEKCVDYNFNSIYYVPVDAADDDDRQWYRNELDIDPEDDPDINPPVKPVYIFEQCHLDGFGNKRTDNYMPVKNYEVGDMIIEATIKQYFSNGKYDIHKEDEHTTVVELIKRKKTGLKMIDHSVLRVLKIMPVDKKTVKQAIQEIENKKEAEVKPESKYTMTFDWNDNK